MADDAAVSYGDDSLLLDETSHRRVAYVWSQQLEDVSSELPSNVGRSRQIHDLVRALHLLRQVDDEEEDVSDGGTLAQPRARVISPVQATRRDLAQAHDLDYIDLLLDPSALGEDSSSSSESDISSSSSSSSSSSRPAKRFRRTPTAVKPTPASRILARLARHQLLDDSPVFPSLPLYAVLVPGAALSAARSLISGEADVAVAWDGGRHHAMRSAASGFCYVNDCVMAVLALAGSGKIREGDKERKPRVLYLDVDVHHGDGVAEAFVMPSDPARKPPNIVTLSLHHASPTFFPSTPLAALTTISTPHPHTLSLPLDLGTSAETMARVWEGCVEQVAEAWKPDWLVVCCGVDGMAGDGEKTGVWNMGAGGERGDLGWCVERLLRWTGVKGTLLLGGGGYNHPNAARAFANFTCIALGRPPVDPREAIPDIGIDDRDWESYGPSFELGVPVGNMQDLNTVEALDTACETFAALADRIRVP